MWITRPYTAMKEKEPSKAMKRSCRRGLIALLFFPLVAVAQSPSASPAPSTLPDVDLIWGLKIPLRDNVRLQGTVYMPAGQKDPLPVIFMLTPYIADGGHSRAYYFAQHGYIFVSVDSRGHGNSEGIFDP